MNDSINPGHGGQQIGGLIVGIFVIWCQKLGEVTADSDFTQLISCFIIFTQQPQREEVARSQKWSRIVAFSMLLEFELGDCDDVPKG